MSAGVRDGGLSGTAISKHGGEEPDRGRPLRVLSIDGGGMRGLYSAEYLASLAQRYVKTRGLEGIDIGRGFDLIAGTSTGAIIACALAAGVPVGRVAKLYRERGPDIFPLRLPRSFGLGLVCQQLRDHET